MCVPLPAVHFILPQNGLLPPPGPALSRWLSAYFLCVLLLFTVDFLCAKMGEHLANTQCG